MSKRMPEGPAFFQALTRLTTVNWGGTEVEETSDIMLLMLIGLHGRTQEALDKVYGEYEEEFGQGIEVARRFRLVMDKIDETFGRHIHSSAFSRKALFHTLFR
jgi:hypothetical protein